MAKITTRIQYGPTMNKANLKFHQGNFVIPKGTSISLMVEEEKGELVLKSIVVHFYGQPIHEIFDGTINL